MPRTTACLVVRTFVCVALALAARAHDVFPTTPIKLRPGGEDYIYVADQGTCPATITVTSPNPGAVKVFSVNMNTGAVNFGSGASASVPNRVDQVFLLRADASVTTSVQVSVQVCWVGSDFPNAPCNENNCNPFVPHIVNVVVDPAAATSGASLNSGVVGDPVQTARGELFLPLAPDLDLGGPLALEFRRYYASRLALEGAASSTLGPGWLHNFAWRLVSTGNNVEVTDDTGRVIRFERRYLATNWSLAVAEDIPYQLIASGPGFALADPLTGLRRVFDATGKLTSVSDGKGNTHTLSYVGSLLTSVSDGQGRTLTFTHNLGRLTNVSDGTRNVAFGYDGSNRLSSSTDAGGDTTTYAYDPAAPTLALMTSSTRPIGNTPYTQTYDANSRVATQTDALSNATSFAYDTANHATTLTDALGQTQVHDHDADGDLTSWEDEGGSSVTLQNDADGRRTALTDRLGRTTSWTVHAPSGRIARVTEADGAVTNYSYTARSSGGFTFYDLTAIAHADGSSESFGYDANGNRTSWTDRGGETWSFTHNARGQVLTATNPAGGVTNYTYNADGTLASVSVPLSTVTALGPPTAVTTFGYDALRRVEVVTFPDLTTRHYSYDALDRITAITDEAGATTQVSYDDNGNVATLTDPASNAWTFDYDALDRVEVIRDPLLHATSAVYDELGRVATVQDATGKSLQLDYDLRGRLISAANSTGQTWSTVRDLEGVPSSSSEPGGATTSFLSDRMGRITVATRPSGAAWSLSYNAVGGVTRLTNPLGKFVNYTHDPRGGLKSIALPISGANASFTRSELNQITRLTLPGAAHWDSSFNAHGLLTQTTDPLGRSKSFDQDPRKRTTQVTLPGALGTVNYEYDGASRLTRRNYSDGLDLSYTYDSNGAVTATSGASFGYDAARRMTSCNGLALTYDAARRIDTITYAPGEVVQYGYNARGLNTSIQAWFDGITTFSYDDAGRTTAIERPNGVDTWLEYSEDGQLDRILETQGPTRLSQIELEYDLAGRVRRAMRDNPLFGKPADYDLMFGYDAAQQTLGWNWDPLGRLLGDGASFSATYDLASRVQSLDEGGELYDFQYDGFDNLVGFQWRGDQYQFVRNYAFGNAPPAKLSVNGSLRYSFVQRPDGSLFSAFDHLAQTARYYHFDERGSTLFRTDDAGAITDRYAYDPLGALVDRDGGDDNWFRHRGRFGTLSVGTGRFQHDGKRLFDACTLRYFVAPAYQLAIYLAEVASWFEGDSFTAPPRQDATEILDEGWKAEQGTVAYKLESRFLIEARYDYDYDEGASAATAAPAPPDGVDVPDTPQVALEARYMERGVEAMGLGIETQIVDAAPENHRRAVAKFRAARALVQQLRPRSQREQLRQQIIDAVAARAGVSLVLGGGFGELGALMLLNGPSEVRGALQDPAALRYRLNGGTPLSNVPFLFGAFNLHAARAPLLTLMRAHLAREEY